MQLPYDRRNKLTVGGGAEIAISALKYLASDSERLERFLSLSGLGPHNLRRAAADPAFLGAVLDYVAGDETLIIAFAQEEGMDPAQVAAARAALASPGTPFE